MASLTDHRPQVLVINRSAHVSLAELRAVVAAVDTQVQRDFGPAWGYFDRVRLAGAHGPTRARKKDAVIIVVDHPDTADSDGWHSLTKSGRPWGIVAVQPELDAGTEWSVALSHEVLELDANRWLGYSIVHRRRAYALEVCDPVEADRYAYEINGVLVSDFVLPSWYRLTDETTYDFRGHCKRPFQILPGGYLETEDFRQGSGRGARALRRHDGSPIDLQTVPSGSRRRRRPLWSSR